MAKLLGKLKSQFFTTEAKPLQFSGTLWNVFLPLVVLWSSVFVCLYCPWMAVFFILCMSTMNHMIMVEALHIPASSSAERQSKRLQASKHERKHAQFITKQLCKYFIGERGIQHVLQTSRIHFVDVTHNITFVCLQEKKSPGQLWG